MIITGIDSTIVFFLLIALNGFFCYVKVPILAYAVTGVSVIYLIGFSIDFTGINVILTLILIIFAIGSLAINIKDYQK